MLSLLPRARVALLSFGLAVPAVAQQTIADFVVAQSGGATAGTFDQNGNDYDILLTALNAAGLTGAVADPDASLTVFAPRDRAFVRLARDLGYTGSDEQGTWQYLVTALTTLGNGDPIPTLTDILTYHVSPSRVSLLAVIWKTLTNQTIPTLLAGATIRPFFVVLKDNEPDLTNPVVTAPLNKMLANGILHTIDRVLIPVDLP